MYIGPTFFSAARRPSDFVTEQQTWQLFWAQIHVIATYMDLYEQQLTGILHM